MDLYYDWIDSNENKVSENSNVSKSCRIFFQTEKTGVMHLHIIQPEVAKINSITGDRNAEHKTFKEITALYRKVLYLLTKVLIITTCDISTQANQWTLRPGRGPKRASALYFQHFVKSVNLCVNSHANWSNEMFNMKNHHIVLYRTDRGGFLTLEDVLVKVLTEEPHKSWLSTYTKIHRQLHEGKK